MRIAKLPKELEPGGAPKTVATGELQFCNPNSAFFFPTCSAWSQAFWQFRISQSAFRISPTSLLPYLPAGTSNREQ